MSQVQLEQQTPRLNEKAKFQNEKIHDSAKRFRPTSMLEHLSKPRVTVSHAPLQVCNMTVKPKLERYLVRYNRPAGPEVPTVMPPELTSRPTGITVVNRDIAYSPTKGTRAVMVSPMMQSTA